jgi:type IV secretion system protein VirB10
MFYSNDGGAGAGPGAPGGAPRSRAERLAELQEAALRSAVESSRTGGAHAQPAYPPPATAAAPAAYRGAEGAGHAAPRGHGGGGGQAGAMAAQRDFYMGRGRGYPGQGQWAGAAGGPVIPAGTIVRVALENGIDSTLPGPVFGRVLEPVWDATMTRVVIPANTLVMGTYNSGVRMGQSRMQFAWDRLFLERVPGQRVAVELGGMPGVSLDGASGVSARVDDHFDRALGATLVGALAAGAAGAAGGPVNPLAQNPGQVALSTAGGSVARGANAWAARYLDATPTLSLPQGSVVGMMLTRDLQIHH